MPTPKFPTGNATAVGVWTNGTTGLNADDGTNATFTTTTKNDVRSLTVGGFGFDAALPSAATITSVALEVQEQVTTGGTLRAVIIVGGVDGTLNDNTTDTALTVRTYSALTRPGGGSWTRADLINGTLTARVEGRQPNNTTSRAYTFDYVKVIVEWSLPLTPATTTNTAVALAFTKPIRVALTPATTTNTAVALAFTKPLRQAITPATTTNTAVALSFTQGTPQHVAITPATETDSAQAQAFTKPIRKALTAAAETDAAQSLAFIKPIHVALSPGQATEAAQPLTFTKPLHASLTPAAESDLAVALSVTGPIHVALSAAVETDTAFAMERLVLVGSLDSEDGVADLLSPGGGISLSEGRGAATTGDGEDGASGGDRTSTLTGAID